MGIDTAVKSIHYQEVDPGVGWIKDPDIAIDSDGPLDSVRALTPNVVKMENGYRMYYHGFGPQRPNAESKGYILSAFSGDAQKWEKEFGVRMDAGGEGAEHYIWSPRRGSPGGWPLQDVLRGQDRGGRRRSQERHRQRPVARRSRSGKRNRAFGWALTTGSYGAPRCLYLDPGSGQDGPRYRLYASDFHDHRIVSAVSGDGLHFDMEPGVRISREKEQEAYEVYAPEVLHLGTGGYRMYYAGWVSAPEVTAGSKFHGRIFSAFSDDGLHWRKDTGICLDNGGRWDTAKASEPCVINLADGRFRMFYEACDLEGRWRIASATSPASDQ